MSEQSTTPKSLRNNGFILGNVKSARADKILGSGKIMSEQNHHVRWSERLQMCYFRKKGHRKCKSQDSCRLESEMENMESQGVPLDPCSQKEQLNLSRVKCSSPLTPWTIKPADMRSPGEHKTNRAWKNHSRTHQPLIPVPSPKKCAPQTLYPPPSVLESMILVERARTVMIDLFWACIWHSTLYTHNP